MSILFDVPETYKTAVDTGRAVLRGVNIMDTATGKILAHVQEVGGATSKIYSPSDIISTAFKVASPVTGVVGAASSVAANLQLAKITKMMEVLGFMAKANLAVSGIGLGVSAVGFVVVARKLGKMHRTLEGIDKQISELKEDTRNIRGILEARDQSRFTSAMEQGEEAWHRSDRTEVWKHVEKLLIQEDHYYRALMRQQYDDGLPFTLSSMVTPEQLQTVCLTSGTLAAARVRCMLLIGEPAGAAHYARGYAKTLSEIFDQTSPSELIHHRIEASTSSTAEYDEHKVAELPGAMEFLDAMLEQAALANSQGDLVETLQEKEIDPVAYVEESTQMEPDLVVLSR